MLDQFFNSISYIALTKAIDTTAMRQKAIAENIANAETPHYKRIEVNFEDAFKQAMEKKPKRLAGFRTCYGHIPINPPTDFNSVAPAIWRENDTYTRADDNNVELDVEMAENAKNDIKSEALMEALSRKFKYLRSAMGR